MQARYTGLIAKGSVPVVIVPNDWEYDAVDNFMKSAEHFLSEEDKEYKVGRYYMNIHKYMNLLDERTTDPIYKEIMTALQSDNPDIRYILTKVWPKVNPDGFVAFRDRSTQYLVAEQSWFDRFINDIQYLVTTQMQMVLRGGFTIKPYGLGTVTVDKKGLTVKYTPSIYTSFFSENKVKLFLISDDRTQNDKAFQFMWTYLLARKMQLISKQFGLFTNPGMLNREDWLAAASEQISYIAGYGESSATLKYQATDTVGLVRDAIGDGLAEAYEWQDFPPELFEELLEFWVIRRMAAANVKIPTTPVTLELTGRSDKLRASYDWTKESVSQLPGLGGDSSPYMFMPRNDLGNNFVWPMVLREDPDKPNVYKRQPQRVVPMQAADVRHGEIQGNPLEPTAIKESYIHLNVFNDSRRWDITYPWYKLYVWKFPLQGVKPSEWKMNGGSFLSSDESKTFQWMMFLLSSMTEGTTSYGEGFFVYDSLGLFGDVPAPYVYGPANPIQQAISQKPMESRADAEKVRTTPAPGAVSLARTAPETAPSPIAKQMETPVEAKTTETPATPPPNIEKKEAPAVSAEQKA